MVVHSIRPVGNPILWAGRGHSLELNELARPYRAIYVNSGTAALALALQAACGRVRVKCPEVILPAYGCPDLISAAVYAGVRPVLVDITPDSINYDPQAVASQLRPNTVAIVAAAFLGIRPDHQRLREIIGDRGVLLIEDSAQWFPRNSAQSFFGDCAVLSFGRGKPVSLLGGGALLTPARMEIPLAPRLTTDVAGVRDATRIFIYNITIRRYIYGIAERLPGLGIGLTEYEDLDEIVEMSPRIQRRLGANIAQYVSKTLYIQNAWRKRIEDLANPSIVDLAAMHRVPCDHALLRYPLLLESQRRRDELYSRLQRQGLGASIMYGNALPDIKGVGPHLTSAAAIGYAREFAGRLLTLPTHDDINDSVIERTLEVMRH